MRVYIAGPIAGYENGNRERFEKAEKILTEQGYEAVNPHKIEPYDHNGPCPEMGYFPGENDRQHTSSCCFMRTDLRALLSCDYIYLLQGWRESKGASFEAQTAQVCGIPAFGGWL